MKPQINYSQFQTKPQTDYSLLKELLSVHQDTNNLLQRIHLSGTYFDAEKEQYLVAGLKTCDNNLKLFWN